MKERKIKDKNDKKYGEKSQFIKNFPHADYPSQARIAPLWEVYNNYDIIIHNVLHHVY